MLKCQRCNEECNITIMSFFNSDHLCMKCVIKEEEHPKYNIARDTKKSEVLKGNYNFPGIGLPNDLKMN